MEVRVAVIPIKHPLTELYGNRAEYQKLIANSSYKGRVRIRLGPPIVVNDSGAKALVSSIFKHTTEAATIDYEHFKDTMRFFETREGIRRSGMMPGLQAKFSGRCHFAAELRIKLRKNSATINLSDAERNRHAFEFIRRQYGQVEQAFARVNFTSSSENKVIDRYNTLLEDAEELMAEKGVNVLEFQEMPSDLVKAFYYRRDFVRRHLGHRWAAKFNAIEKQVVPLLETANQEQEYLKRVLDEASQIRGLHSSRPNMPVLFNGFWVFCTSVGDGIVGDGIAAHVHPEYFNRLGLFPSYGDINCLRQLQFNADAKLASITQTALSLHLDKAEELYKWSGHQPSPKDFDLLAEETARSRLLGFQYTLVRMPKKAGRGNIWAQRLNPKTDVVVLRPMISASMYAPVRKQLARLLKPTEAPTRWRLTRVTVE